MIKTLAPFSDSARTAEIMSRYRPIAPKPESPASDKISHSPYLRHLWPQLQARPTRTRKRGRAIVSPPSFKRTRAHPLIYGFAVPNAPPQPDLVTLPLLPCQPDPRGKLGIDLNTVAEVQEESKDLSFPSPTAGVISPQAVRPVGSTVRVGCIGQDSPATPPERAQKTPEEVEEEVEAEEFPAIVSDSSYRVRLANSAYKEMVGQPECTWLDSIVAGKRICGEVTLQLATEVPSSSEKFFCWVNIEWGQEGKKTTVHAFCDVVRLECLSKDYLYSWRFHTGENCQASSSSA